jgi:tRNA A-37 threonylcarbamoyl transferase component Bud32
MHVSVASDSAPTPAELCGYAVRQVLTANQSYLADGPGGRPVVLKKVDEDCLLRSKLHPSIKERLSRVRELAHGGVANLYGVDRDGEDAYLIWEYVPGQTFDEYVAAPARTPRDLLLLARELILSVDSLHMQGIVHGALIGGNVIVSADGLVRLTHISPLLYTDMSVDVESVRALLEHAVECRGETASPLGQLLTEANRDRIPLRQLGAKVGALLEAREPPPETSVQIIEERHIRRRTILAAAVVAVLGLAIGYGVWRTVEAGPDLHPAPTWFPNVPASK